jgi:hypothetical protein
MSKTNDTSKLDRVKIETRVLADSELDAVSGGTFADMLGQAVGQAVNVAAQQLTKEAGPPSPSSPSPGWPIGW